jgi:hypothetical protein
MSSMLESTLTHDTTRPNTPVVEVQGTAPLPATLTRSQYAFTPTVCLCVATRPR